MGGGAHSNHNAYSRPGNRRFIAATVLLSAASMLVSGCEQGTTRVLEDVETDISSEKPDPDISSSASTDPENIDVCAPCVQLQRRCILQNSGDVICGGCLAGTLQPPSIPVLGVTDACVPACATLNCTGQSQWCLDSGNATPECVPECPTGLSPSQDGRCGACDVTSDCPSGFYCDADDGGQDTSICRQDCSADMPERCQSPDICTAHGRCLQAAVNGESCGAAYSEGELIPPDVLIVLDASGSMTAQLANAEEPIEGEPPRRRWEEMVDALTHPSFGVVPLREHQVRFGLLVYQSKPCYQPGFPNVTPELYQSTNINELLADNGPGGGTPTVFALQEATAILDTIQSQTKAVILATDGAPNKCTFDENGDRDGSVSNSHEVEAQVRLMYEQHGITTYALGISYQSTHLQRLARLGQGIDPFDTEDQRLYIAEDPAALSEQLETILELELSCLLRFDQFDPQAQDFEVYFNGDLIGSEEWAFHSMDNTLELLGNACTRATQGGTINSIGAVATNCGGSEQ